MRKLRPYRVCSCTPEKGIVQLESSLLATMVNRDMRRITCWQNLRHVAHRAMILGDICFRTGHQRWAIKVWNNSRRFVEFKDYGKWKYAHWTDKWYWLDDLTAEPECRELGRRADDAWRRLGHAEMAVNEQKARDAYDYLWIVKYDFDRNEPDPEDEEPDSSIEVFNDGLPYWKPLSTQYIYTLYD